MVAVFTKLFLAGFGMFGHQSISQTEAVKYCGHSVGKGKIINQCRNNLVSLQLLQYR